jgi:excisionase family DNA binding protein
MHEWVSVEEASRRLGVSVSTIRRRIEAGDLVGEREVIGGSKERYRVRLEMPQDEQAHSESGDAPETRHDAPTVAEGLLALVREMRQQGVNDAARIADLMRQLGAAEASAKLLAEQRADFARWLDEAREEAARLRAEATRKWWRRW